MEVIIAKSFMVSKKVTGKFKDVLFLSLDRPSWTFAYAKIGFVRLSLVEVNHYWRLDFRNHSFHFRTAIFSFAFSQTAIQ